MPKPKPSSDETRDELIKSYGQAAAKAHDVGNEAAAGALTDAVLQLRLGKKK